MNAAPSRPQQLLMKAYSKVDQYRTSKELERETYTFQYVREKILAIGRKVK